MHSHRNGVISHCKQGVTTSGKNRIVIYGPKDDGTYVVEFITPRRANWKPPFKPERLLNQSGPLHSFNGTIELGLALGLYGPVIYNDLHTIREIRNGFAHAMVPLNFDTPEVAAEIDKLKYLALVKSYTPMPLSDYRTPTLADFIARGIVPSATSREKFTLTCELISADVATHSGDYTTRAKEPRLP